jgi:hypothetical protein
LRVHHTRRYLVWVAMVGHRRVYVGRGWLTVHHGRVFGCASVCHGSWYGLAAVVVCERVGSGSHSAVGVSFAFGHRVQVPDRRENGTRSPHRHGFAHPGLWACGVFAVVVVGHFGGCVRRVAWDGSGIGHLMPGRRAFL